MDEFAKAIELLANAREWWVIATIVFLVVIFNFNRILDVVDRVQNRKLQKISDYILESKADFDSRQAFEDIREGLAFKTIVGLYAEKPLRIALREFHSSNSSEITWKIIGRSGRYLSERNGEIEVKISWSDLIGYYINSVVMFLFPVLSIFFILVTAIIPERTFEIVVTYLALAFFSFLIAIFCTLQASYVYAARKIETLINEKQRPPTTDVTISR